MSTRLRATILGSGSSAGVPRIGGDWGACDPANPRNRRRRCSLLVEHFGGSGKRPTRIVIDTAPDFREQMLDSGVDAIDAVVFSHDHADQTHGIDDVRVLAMLMRRRVPAFMDAATAATLTEKFRYIFEGKGVYPSVLDLQPFIAAYEAFKIDGPGGPLSLLPLDQEHGEIRSLGFRIGPLAYCNDVSDLPEASLEALQGTEVFIVDALRDRPHPSHAHVGLALDWIARIRPKRAVLTNLHIDLDYAELAARLPGGVVPAHDGLVIEIDGRTAGSKPDFS